MNTYKFSCKDCNVIYCPNCIINEELKSKKDMTTYQCYITQYANLLDCHSGDRMRNRLKGLIQFESSRAIHVKQALKLYFPEYVEFFDKMLVLL